MKKNTLAPHLVMGSLSLNVQDLEAMTEFYTQIMDLEIIKKEKNLVSLGIDEEVLLRLHHEPSLPFSHRYEAGLYHVAFVFLQHYHPVLLPSFFALEKLSYHSLFTPSLKLGKNLLFNNKIGKSSFYGFPLTGFSYGGFK